MANVDSGNGDSGSRDRATVALVDAKVDGLRELMRAEFGFIKERLTPLADIPDRVARLEIRVGHLEAEDSDNEQRDDRKRDWRRGAITTAALALFGVAVNLALTFHWI